MICRDCNTPLEARARFCPRCGSPVTSAHDASVPPAPSQEATVPAPSDQQLQERAPWTPTQAIQQAASTSSPEAVPSWQQDGPLPASPQPYMFPLQEPSPLSYYQPQNIGAKMPPAVVNIQAPSRSRRRGCIPGCLTVLVILLLIVGAGWFFIARPFLHDTATTQLDHAMSSAVEQIPPLESRVLPHVLTVTENALTNMLVLNTAPSDPVQHPIAKISTNGVRFEFQLYGSACAITVFPQAQNGHLVATNVTVEGIIGLILSSADIQTLLNKHLADAQTRIQRRVQSVQLKDHEMNLTLG